MRQISCHISATTAHLFTALEGALEEDIEKESPTLGRSAVYRKSSRIARLPPYLPVLFVRFAYRKDTEKRAKVRAILAQFWRNSGAISAQFF